MSYNLPGEANPFEPPRAGIGEEARYRDLADSDSEMIRRDHIGREANVKSLGHLLYVFAFFGVIGTIFAILMAAGVFPIPPNQAPGVDPNATRVVMAVAAVFYFAITALYIGLGYGLTHLQVWARWTAVVFISLGLVASVIYAVIFAVMASPLVGVVVLVVGGGFYGGLLWLLVSSKAGVVFSPEYKEIIRKTPHVKVKTSLIVKVLLVLLLLFIVLVILAALFGGVRS